MRPRSAIRRGVLEASLAALLFGSTTPLVQDAAAGASAPAVAALLYLGAAVAAGAGLLGRQRAPDAPIAWADTWRVVVMALFGGVLAPVLLVLGLARTDAATSAMLLGLEVPFTLVLARVIHREHLGRRVWLAAALMTGAGIILAGGRIGNRVALIGALEVAGAALGWALDNIVSRSLADRDPLGVVVRKGLLGGIAGVGVSLGLGLAWPSTRGALLLLVIGGLGYGFSLQLYLRAQRSIGAARTASVFSLAPFIGAAAALALGGTWPGWTFPGAAALMGLGLWLHASERHEHAHTHEAMEHEHAHTHDDGHHDHHHEPMPVGPHSHAHRHEPLTHAHEHSEDLHHRHPH